jgi:TolA-binding protein
MESLEYELNKCLSGRGQAVASILGMTTDANVVATLNPGLSMRNLDSGIVNLPSAARATTHTHEGAWETRSGVTRGLYNSGPVQHPTSHPTPSGPVRVPSDPGIQMVPAASGQLPRAASPTQFSRAATPLPVAQSASSAPLLGEATEISPPLDVNPRGGLATFGWVMLILILLGGGGALAYVMLFQNKQEPVVIPAKVDDSVGSAEPDKPEIEKPKKKPSREDRDRDRDRDRDKDLKDSRAESRSETKAEPKPEPKAEPDGKDDGNKAPAKATKKVAAASDVKGTPAQLSETAKKAEAAGDWETVLVAYQKLEKAKSYKFPGFAVYKQAWAYFQLNDTANAQSLAQRASTMPGNQKNDAKLLYADALFKQGDFKRAKDFYIGMRKQVPASQKAQLAKKIASCNQKLKLPDRDGIAD